jgi:DUF4097 and DUF4098 domain-containing protein YvlB
MSTPPNPPSPGQYPPPNSPRDARRYARAQRQYWQAYWRGGRRPSIIGPIILLAIGIIALLVELGRLNGYAIWNWYVQWWPLLLIVLGLISLAEYFFDRRDPYARRRTGGGLVFLIVILLLVGWGAHSARHWGHHIGMDNNDFWYMWGQEHDNDIQMDQAVPANGSVLVQNPRGDVTITPSTDGQLHLRAHEIVHTASDDDAQKAFDAIHPQIETSGTNVTVSVPSHRGSAVNLALEVPEASQVTVNADRGDVAIEGLKKNADVTAPRGDVKFDGIGGDVHARMRDGDFSAHAIGGQVFLNGHAGDVTLSEIKGQTTLDGEFFGDTHLEEMDGPIHFHSSRTTIDLPRLGGDLTLNSDDLQATQTGGPLRIVTRSKNIDLTQAAGDIHIENSNGDINITAAAPLGNIDITNRTGDLTLTVPENASFSVTASTTEDNDLETDFPLQVATSGNQKQISGSVGNGGVHLDLTTRHGDLQLRKGSAETAAPTPPKPPKTSGPVRHLRPPNHPVAPVEQ